VRTAHEQRNRFNRSFRADRRVENGIERDIEARRGHCFRRRALTGAGTHVKSAAQGALAATQNLASSVRREKPRVAYVG